MARKKNNVGGVALGLVVFALYLLSQVPKEVWVLLGVVAVAVLIGFIVVWNRAKGAKLAEAHRQQQSELQPRRSAARSSPTTFIGRKEPELDAASFKGKASGTARWLPFGQEVTVAGTRLPGGLIYVGSELEAPVGGVDPCLIDPSKSVAKHASYVQREMGYWPSYSEVSPAARRAYLNWLAGGRRDPDADVGYVFLFIYGLERRLIVDAELVSAEEQQQIMGEVAALLEIYGGKSNSFRRYADALLDWVTLSQGNAGLYNKPVPAFARSIELPFYVRLALGTTAVDKVVVPAHLAIAWARLDPSIVLRTPAVRCAPEFDKLFAIKYEEAGGILLPHNKSKLRLVYRPASGGFRGQTITLSFGDTPDITALTRPIHQLQVLVDKATEALDSYSRALGKNAASGDTSELFLQLPAALWPERAKAALEDVRKRVRDGMAAMSFKELQSALGASADFTRERTLSLARALEGINIGMEPDVLGGAKNPKAEDPIVLFAIPAGQGSTRDSGYQAAALTLELAAAVAAADGEFSAGEMALLRKQVLSWEHLSEGSSRRLLAHLRLLMLAPVSLSSLKRKLEPLDVSAKETLAVFMATVAASDGDVTPKEVKLLESVYKALNIDVTRVFSDVHAVVVHAEALAARRAGIQHSPAVAPPQTKIREVPAEDEVPTSLAEQSVVGHIHFSDAVSDPVPTTAPEGPATKKGEDGLVQLSEGVEEPTFRIPAPPKAPEAIKDEAGTAPEPVRESPRSKVQEPKAPAKPVEKPAAAPAFKLDAAKIAALRKDTERVSALLGSIFTEEPAVEEVPAMEPEAEVPSDGVQARILGLDDVHTAFARMMLSRPQWSRAELQDLASDLKLMLDGALERVNEAAFDIHDVPFTEGDDPVEVNPEVLEMIEA